MEPTQLRRDVVESFRLLVTAERRLFVGAAVALLAYGAWVGITGTALFVVGALADLEITLVPLSGSATAALAIGTVLWVVVPAVLVTRYLNLALTNVSANLERVYRFQYPLVLVAPIGVLYGLVAVVGLQLGAASDLLLAVLVALGSLVLFRTLAYSYRVFSLSAPLLVQAFVFLSACVLAVTLLVRTAVLAGYRPVVADTARGVDALFGVALLEGLLTGETLVAGVAVPTLPGLAAAVPVALAGLYVLLQVGWGLLARLRGVTVPRSQLRTGQRYPEFARPTTDLSPNTSPGGTTRSPEEPDGVSPGEASDREPTTAERDRSGPSEAEQNVTNTKVYRPPEDAEFDPEIPAVEGDVTDADPERQGADSTATVPGESTDSDTRDGTGYRCPTCEESFPDDGTFAYCPTCGSELRAE